MLYGGGALVGLVLDLAGGNIAGLGSGLAVAVGTGFGCVDAREVVAAGLAGADFGGNTWFNTWRGIALNCIYLISIFHQRS